MTTPAEVGLLVSRHLSAFEARKRYNQGDVARMLNVSQSFYSGLRTGLRTPNVAMLCNIANVLELPLHELLTPVGENITDGPSINWRFSDLCARIEALQTLAGVLARKAEAAA